jgi:hypothetical protein
LDKKCLQSFIQFTIKTTIFISLPLISNISMEKNTEVKDKKRERSRNANKKSSTSAEAGKQLPPQSTQEKQSVEGRRGKSGSGSSKNQGHQSQPQKQQQKQGNGRPNQRHGHNNNHRGGGGGGRGGRQQEQRFQFPEHLNPDELNQGLEDFSFFSGKLKGECVVCLVQ